MHYFRKPLTAILSPCRCMAGTLQLFDHFIRILKERYVEILGVDIIKDNMNSRIVNIFADQGYSGRSYE
jgi:hypothetical protein